MKKSKIKAFTLIELLVVVAIIGILAAVGVVTFTGFTASAKVSTTKAIHAQAVKSLSAETKKCSLGGATYLATNISCSSAYTAAAIITSIAPSGNGGVFTDKNPYNTAAFAVIPGASYVTGQVSVSPGSGTKTLILKTCTDDPCTTAGYLDATIVLE